MSTERRDINYDDILSSIMVKENSILGFLSAVFNFLARKTDFYYVPKNQNENMGFPEGMAEQIVLKVLRACDPKNINTTQNNDIMCSTVAQEVEVVSDNEQVNDDQVIEQKINECEPKEDPEYTPPEIPVQKNSEAYNGAVRDSYSWAQTIMELDVTITLPSDIKTSKDLKVNITSDSLLVQKKTGEVIIKDCFPFKVKGSESFWSIDNGRLLIHLEKAKERWWKKLLNEEEEIDLSKIDCSRPLDELPDDHVAKVRELQWNEERKRQGLPTSEEMRNMEILKKAWNAEGSPFKGQEFDPSVLRNNISM